MAEMPDIISGEVIESEWGNDIRDRTIQRYATAAARTASIPSPNEGDLSYLNDTNRVYVWDGSSWVWVGLLAAGELATSQIADDAVTAVKIANAAIASFVHVDSAVSATTTALTSSFVDMVTVTVNLDTLGWASAKVAATGTGRFLPDNELSGTIEARVSIGSSDGTTAPALFGGTGSEPVVSAAHDATVSGGGSHVIAYQARETGSGTAIERTSSLIVIAVRLT